MTSSNGNIFRITGPLCREFTGPSEFPTQRPVTRSFEVFFICTWINDRVNNLEAGDLRHHHGHYDVNVIIFLIFHKYLIYLTDISYFQPIKHEVKTDILLRKQMIRIVAKL